MGTLNAIYHGYLDESNGSLGTAGLQQLGLHHGSRLKVA